MSQILAAFKKYHHLPKQDLGCRKFYLQWKSCIQYVCKKFLIFTPFHSSQYRQPCTCLGYPFRRNVGFAKAPLYAYMLYAQPKWGQFFFSLFRVIFSLFLELFRVNFFSLLQYFSCSVEFYRLYDRISQFTFRLTPKCLIAGHGWSDGGVGGVAPPNIFKFVRKLIKSLSCTKRVRHSICYELLFFLVIIVGQLVAIPFPPTEGASEHHCFWGLE